ncbi:hypothetical protein Vafri_13048 [Volvox africanus]|uniref:Copper amine oxidase catalytic domain-containing protein n=1 Tax=Volvox africanus TaxID=51714 RepID=A0A8J4F360_9CHLO|nr:hypothetical protein Vafri_13048 [Volvox africanus]
MHLRVPHNPSTTYTWRLFRLDINVLNLSYTNTIKMMLHEADSCSQTVTSGHMDWRNPTALLLFFSFVSSCADRWAVSNDYLLRNISIAGWNRSRQQRVDLDITCVAKGPSHSLNGGELSWQKWRMCIEFNGREGDAPYMGKGRVQLVIHSASLVEVAFPYGDSM